MTVEELLAAAQKVKDYASAVESHLFREMGVKKAQEEIRISNHLVRLLETEARRKSGEPSDL